MLRFVSYDCYFNGCKLVTDKKQKHRYDEKNNNC